MMYSRLSLRHVEARACRELWCAVLTNAVRDLCGCGTTRSAQTLKTMAEAREAAEAWVGTWPSRDFRLVCEGAGLEGRAVHDRLRTLIDLSPEDRRQKMGPFVFAIVQSNTDGPGKGSGRGSDRSSGGGTGRVPRVTTRREQVKEMFARGISPSQMPSCFAAAGLQVSMSTIWNDIRWLRASGRPTRPVPPSASRRKNVMEKHTSTRSPALSIDPASANALIQRGHTPKAHRANYLKTPKAFVASKKDDRGQSDDTA